MTLRFLAIDPDTNGENCPALFLEEETGDLLFQGCGGHRSCGAGRVGHTQPAGGD